MRLRRLFGGGTLLMLLGVGVGALSRYQVCPAGAICVDNPRIGLDVGILLFLFGLALVVAGLLMVDPTWSRKDDARGALN